MSPILLADWSWVDASAEFDAQLLFSEYRVPEDDLELSGGKLGPAAETSLTLEGQLPFSDQYLQHWSPMMLM